MPMTPVSAPNDPLPLVLIVLSAVTGLVDAVSVLGLGQVFVANMTGNTVFLGFAVGGAPGFEVPRYVVALLAFLVGALAGGWVANIFAQLTRRRWLLIVAAMETILFWAAAVVALGYDAGSLSPAYRLFTLIGLTALAMGLRNATVRRLKVPDLTTTVLTLTLTGLAAGRWGEQELAPTHRRGAGDLRACRSARRDGRLFGVSGVAGEGHGARRSIACARITDVCPPSAK
jgi:uncharacterized membrane protein YoaK (UPF0700 family)